MIEKEKIELLRKKGETYRQIAHSFGVSLSCIYQIHNNKNINPLEHKLWSSEKRKLLGLPNIKNYEESMIEACYNKYNLNITKLIYNKKSPFTRAGIHLKWNPCLVQLHYKLIKEILNFLGR